MEALTELLRAAKHYSEASGIIVLLPKDRLPFPLEGNTPEKQQESLLTKSEEVFAVFYPDSPFDITYSFARRFWRIICIDLSMSRLAKMLRKLRK